MGGSSASACAKRRREGVIDDGVDVDDDHLTVIDVDEGVDGGKTFNLQRVGDASRAITNVGRDARRERRPGDPSRIASRRRRLRTLGANATNEPGFPRTPSEDFNPPRFRRRIVEDELFRTARRRRRRRSDTRFKEIPVRAPKTKMKAPPTSTHRQRAGRTQTDHSHPSIERPAVASFVPRVSSPVSRAASRRRVRAAGERPMSNHNLFARSVRARPPHPLSSIVCDAGWPGNESFVQAPDALGAQVRERFARGGRRAHARRRAAPGVRDAEETQSCCKEPSVNEGPAPRVALKTMAPSDAARRGRAQADARGRPSGVVVFGGDIQNAFLNPRARVWAWRIDPNLDLEEVKRRSRTIDSGPRPRRRVIATRGRRPVGGRGGGTPTSVASMVGMFRSVRYSCRRVPDDGDPPKRTYTRMRGDDAGSVADGAASVVGVVARLAPVLCMAFFTKWSSKASMDNPTHAACVNTFSHAS